MARTADRATAARWYERIRRWKQSALTVTEFCRREAVSQASFFQWRKRLGMARPSSGTTPRSASRMSSWSAKLTSRRSSSRTSPRRPSHTPPRFVELPAPTWSQAAQVQITLPGGVIVLLPSQASAELITAVIRAAMSGSSPESRSC
jgi:hypothetical protein